MSGKAYIVDLKEQMAECDANYIRIMKLLPGFSASEKREVALPFSGVVDQLVVILEVVEKFKYTSTVKVSQTFPGNEQLYRVPVMLVRVYHDAKTAEVISYQSHRHFAPCYELPNEKMYHRDEKSQLNKFLAEWLSLCLEKGLIAGAQLEGCRFLAGA